MTKLSNKDTNRVKLIAAHTVILLVLSNQTQAANTMAAKVDFFDLVTIQDLSFATDTLTQLRNTSMLLRSGKEQNGNTQGKGLQMDDYQSDCCRAKICGCNPPQHNTMRSRNINAIGWIMERLADTLEDTLSEIDALLNSEPTIQKRNIIGDAISSITGLATEDQLQQTMDLITSSNAQADHNLLSIVELATKQHSLEQQLRRTNEVFTNLFYNSIKMQIGENSRNIHLMAYAIRLTRIVDNFHHKWTQIADSLMHNRPNYHTMPGEALQQANQKFERFYGKVNLDIKMGILGRNGRAKLLTTLTESTVHFFLHKKDGTTRLVSHAHIPLFKHGFELHPIPGHGTQENWLAVNQHGTEGILIHEQERYRMPTYDNIMYLKYRPLVLNTKEIQCLQHPDKNTHGECIGTKLRMLDDFTLLFMGEKLELQIICNQTDTKAIHISKYQVASIPGHCQAISGTFTIPSFGMNSDIRLEWTFPPTQKDSDSLLYIEDIHIPDLLRQHGVKLGQLASNSESLRNEDFLGDPRRTLQNLKFRLKERVRTSKRTSHQILNHMIPVYVIAGIITLCAITVLMILIYITRLA